MGSTEIEAMLVYYSRNSVERYLISGSSSDVRSVHDLVSFLHHSTWLPPCMSNFVITHISQ